ncbi:MAG TPA: DUF1549 domain-containing protein, partial [Verrucomicrobiales bacterium]|nr:DUF1549 domain-containing protein [Verrucomicrobiales bacterium]
MILIFRKLWRTLPLAVLTAGTGHAAPLRYNRDIRPLLSDNCFYCHGPDKNHRKGGLRLDLSDEVLKPAKSGKVAIVPGKPEASELIARINQTDPDELMPPAEAHKVLSQKQKDLLRQWVAEGAAYEAHWAYTPVVRPAVPAVKEPNARILNPIDAFIQQPLLEKGIAPSPAADRATLCRRLFLDLTGLPPSPGEVDAFVADRSSDAFEKLAEKLMSRPQYGERMAQHWLDVVRYADTVGIHGDQNQNAWAYRDWVINAFNTNKRFDAFTTEQLAGDLLPNPTASQWTATCFNRLTMMTREGGAQPKEYLAKYTADRVRTVSMAWMGATLGCAECHDHKFDPWQQKDFYSLGAFFGDLKQWGVYNDYSYSPNPDLKGFGNEHPFPPERMVKSEALVNRITELEGRIQTLLTEAAGKVAADPARLAAFKSWCVEVSKRLNEDGWESTGAPRVVEPAAGPPKKAKTKTAKPVQAPVQPEPVATPEAIVSGDQRILFAKGGPRNAEITLPVTGPVCSVQLNLLADESHKKSIARSGSSVTLKPVFERIGADGKSHALAIRYADSAEKKPRYANGFEVLGVESGWTTIPERAAVTNESVWLFETPAIFGEGESLKVTLKDNNAGCVSVRVSPLVCVSPSPSGESADPGTIEGGKWRLSALPAPPRRQDMQAHLAAADGMAMQWFVRCTPGDPVLKAVHEIERGIFACRGGWTPVMVTERTDKPLTIRVLP